MGELSNTTINGVSYDFKDAGAARQSHSHTKSQITDFPTSMPASDVPAWAKASAKPTYTASEVGAIATSAKGAANGVASLDSTGKVPSSQLPSYVDDVLEYSAKTSFPATGETGKIYVDKSNNKTYRWSGSAYVEISESLALGETSSTAYRGDRGKAAYDHSQTTSGNPHNTTAAETGAVPNTAAGVSAAINQLTTGDSAPTDNDYYVSQYAGGGTSTTTYHRRPVSKLWDYIKSKLSLSTTGSGNAVTGVSYSNGAFTVTKGSSFAASSHTHNYAGSSSAGGAATSANKLNTNAGSATQPVYFSNGVPVATTYTLGKSVPSDAKFTDTTYSAATTSAAGLMSAADKTKLNGIATGAQVNSITGVKGNAESSYRTGNVNLTAANIGAAAASDVSVTTIVNPNTFATSGFVNLGGCQCFINKHGRHITGSIICRSFNSSPEPSTIAFTINSGYRPASSSLGLFLLKDPYADDYTGYMLYGNINTEGAVRSPGTITKGFTILLDYFTA